MIKIFIIGRGLPGMQSAVWHLTPPTTGWTTTYVCYAMTHTPPLKWIPLETMKSGMAFRLFEFGQFVWGLLGL